MSPVANPRQARLQRKLARLRCRAVQFPDVPAPDLHGGSTPLKDVSAEACRLRDRIQDEVRAGSHRHRRILRHQRWHVRILPALDAVVLFWFLAGVLDADLRHPDTTVLIAAVLALLCTVAVAAWNTGVGHYLRRFKAHDGGLVVAEIDGVGMLMLTATGIVWGLLAVLMYVRVSDEVFQATAVLGIGAVVVGLVLAAAIVLVNAYVLTLAVHDGSELTSDLDRLGTVLDRPVRRHLRDLAAIDGVERRIELIRTSALHRGAEGDKM